jgi:cysteine desulfurase
MITYLDHHAASPCSPHVLERMVSVLRAEMSWCNPSSVHAGGRIARRYLEGAREQVAAALHTQTRNVIFTSGGTEACNLGVFGLVGGWAARGPRTVLTTDIEHPAVSEAVAALQQTTQHESEADANADTKLVALDRLDTPGGLAPDGAAFERLLQSRRYDLVAIQWVNHETGTVLPVEQYAQVCERLSIPLFVDASQAWGKLPVDMCALAASGVTAMAFGATKIGGPSGAGALWVATGVDVERTVVGGGQERGRRGGSPNVVASVGMGAAAEQIGARLEAMSEVAKKRDALEQGLLALGARVNGAGGPRVSTVTNVSFEGLRGDDLVAALDLQGVCCSSGAACSSGLQAPSPVLTAMHRDEPWRAKSALRCSLGPNTTWGDIEHALRALREVVGRVRSVKES